LTATPATSGRQDARATEMRHSHPHARILLVDDDAVVRRFYSKVLTGSGYRVDTAEDGEAGWKALHDAGYDPESYDLLITDHNMPKLTGVELIENLRSARMFLPVILVTAAEPLNTERLHLAALLRKPVSPAQLLRNVTEVLQPASPDRT
jgi:DNA-binding response OmpR family regulator